MASPQERSDSSKLPLPSRLPSQDAKVLVVGAGVAGLVTALECWRRGFDIEILERTDGQILTGDTVSLAPSCLGVFGHWPQIAVEHNKYGYDALISYVKHSGEHIFGPMPAPMGQPDADLSNTTRTRCSFMHSRPQVYQTFLSEVHRCGIPVRFNTTVTDYFEDEEAGRGGVLTEDGQKLVVDIVVAADGVASVSYKLVTGTRTKAKSSGFSMYRVGATPMASQRKRAMIHHNLGPSPDHRVYADISARVRCHVAYLDDADTAPAMIDATIQECLNQWLPVYIYVPLDYIHVLVKEPESSLEPSPTQSATMNEKASTHIFDALRKSSKRIVLVDLLATCHGASHLLKPLVDLLNCPIYCTPMGKGAIDETHPRYAGVYSGGTSAPGIQEAVESSNCVLHLGPLRADSNTGGFSTKIEEDRLTSIEPYQCVVFEEVFQGTHIKAVLKEILKLATSQPLPAVDSPTLPANCSGDDPSDCTITQAWLWPSLEKFLRPNDILIVEAGTAQFGMPDATFPANVRYITQVYYGCIGYSVGCCVGAGLAQREIQCETNTEAGRLILVVGDGSIQLSVQEIGTMIKTELTPIIVLLNNEGYAIERAIHKPTETYHGIAQWRWQSMLDFFGAENPAAATSIVQTKAELEYRMASPEVTAPTQMQLVELRMGKFDAPWRLRRQIEIVGASKNEEA